MHGLTAYLIIANYPVDKNWENICVCVFGMAQKRGRRMFRNTHATAQTFGEPLKILSKA